MPFSMLRTLVILAALPTISEGFNLFPWRRAAASVPSDNAEPTPVESDSPPPAAPMGSAPVADTPQQSPDQLLAAAKATAKQAAAPSPELPAVKTMLESADQTVGNIAAQAAKIEARVREVEKTDQEKMLRQKAAFEADLQAREQATRIIADENVHIASNIEALQKDNDGLKARAKELEAENKGMRDELRTVTARLGNAGGFIKDSLKATDDRKSKELVVLTERKAPPKPVDSRPVEDPSSTDAGFSDSTAMLEEGVGSARDDSDPKSQDNSDQTEDSSDDKDDSDSNDDDTSSGTSFLALASRARVRLGENMEESQPPLDGQSKDLLTSLGAGLEDLMREDRASENEQVKLYKHSVAKQHLAHEQAIAQQRTLNATQASLMGLQARLGRAVSHLEATSENLHERLHGLGQYLQRLSHLVLAPPAEAAPSLGEMTPPEPSAVETTTVTTTTVTSTTTLPAVVVTSTVKPAVSHSKH